MGIIKGKDIVESTITENKLESTLQEKLLNHAKILGVDLSEKGFSGSLTFDDITVTVTNNGDFLNAVFTCTEELPDCLFIRTIYSGTGSGSQNMIATINSEGTQFTDLTTGANPRVEFEIASPSRNAIYHLHCMADASSGSGLTNCNAYVEKM